MTNTAACTDENGSENIHPDSLSHPNISRQKHKFYHPLTTIFVFVFVSTKSGYQYQDIQLTDLYLTH